MSQNPFASPQEISEPALVLDFRDRSVGLVLFGVLEILIGLFFAINLVSSAVMIVSQPTMPPFAIISFLAIYGLVAVGAVWLGIGSIRARRWARSLILATAWPWLIAGMTGMVLFAVALLPVMYREIAQDSKMPQAAILPIMIFAIGIAGVMYVLLPLAIVAFYQSKHVKATCERKDPTPRWTDRCPQSVLTLSVVFAFGAYSSFCWALAGGMSFVFGAFLHGLPGVAVSLAIALVCGLLAWGLYRLHKAAWWTALLLSLLLGISMVVSCVSANWNEMYQHLGMADAQLQAAHSLVSTVQLSMVWGGVIGSLVFVGYLLMIRKHFVTAPATQPAESASPTPESREPS